MSDLDNPLLSGYGAYDVASDLTGNYNDFMYDTTGDEQYATSAPRQQDFADYEKYDAALAEWYASTPADALIRDADKQLWAVQAYNAGDLSAEEAQDMWDSAFDERYGAGYGGEQSGDGYTEVSTDKNGNKVVSYYRPDGTLRNTETYGRVVFGETDTGSYADYVQAVSPEYEQFRKGFWDGFMDTPFAGIAMTVAASALTGPLAAGLQSSLGLSATAAKAAASAIINAASQLAATGELDWKQALVQAGLSYGGDVVGDFIKNNETISGALNSVKDFGDDMLDVIGAGGDALTTGNAVLDAAIKAGGMSTLTQLVTTGEVDIKQAAIAAIAAGGAASWSELKAELDAAGIAEDEYMQDLAEYEEFQQAAIDADIKDPFLNPNYETVGDGLLVNAAGEVFNYDGKSMGTMDDLDLDGDGQITGSDLAEVETPDRELVDEKPWDDGLGYEMGDDVYVDANGNPVDPDMVKFGPDGYTYNGEPVSTKPYNEVYGGDRGGLSWQSEGGTDGYIQYENGELAYRKVTTTETLLDADGNPYESEVTRWVDADGNIVDDPTKVDELTMIAAKEIDAPLESVEYFDQDGNPLNYRYTGYELRDNLEQGQFSGLIFGPNGEVQEVWYDPTTGTEYIKSDEGFVGVEQVDLPEEAPEQPEQPTEESTDDSGDSGQGTTGGGETSDTGGVGDSGVVGGGGTPGSSSPSGGDSADTEGGFDYIDVVLPDFNQDTTAPDFGTDDDLGGVVEAGPDDNVQDGSDIGTGGDMPNEDGTGGVDEGVDVGSGGDEGVSEGVDTGADDDNDLIGGGWDLPGTGADGSDAGGSGPDGGTDGGDSGGSDSGTSSGNTNRPGIGTGTDPGEGPSEGPGGDGTGSGGESGMLSGGSHDPEWGELFAYTVLTPYQKEAMRPYVDYIEKARGMLS